MKVKKFRNLKVLGCLNSAGQLKYLDALKKVQHSVKASQHLEILMTYLQRPRVFWLSYFSE